MEGSAEKNRFETPATGHIRRGVGMAAGLWVAGGGNPPSTVIVKLFSDGSANLNMGASDIGTGTKTVMAMVVAEELGVKPEALQIENADTGTTQYATPSGGSKTVPTEAPTVRAAALSVKQQLLELAAQDLKAECRGPGAASGMRSCLLWTRRKRSRSSSVTGSQEARGDRGRRIPRPEPRGQGGEPLCSPVLRGRGEHEDRRGQDHPVPGSPRQRKGDEPADLRQPGLRRHRHGHRLRYDRGAGSWTRTRPARW